MESGLTPLPASGRTGPAPESPYDLAEAGTAWWVWAWTTPQATRWDAGALYAVARRAQLEDDVAMLGFGEDHLDLADLLVGVADKEATRRVEWALTMLKKAASGKLALEKEMRELDGRLGLNPRAMVDLGWVIGEADKETDDLDDLAAKRAKRIARGAAAQNSVGP